MKSFLSVKKTYKRTGQMRNKEYKYYLDHKCGAKIVIDLFISKYSKRPLEYVAYLVPMRLKKLLSVYRAVYLSVCVFSLLSVSVSLS